MKRSLIRIVIAILGVAACGYGFAQELSADAGILSSVASKGAKADARDVRVYQKYESAAVAKEPTENKAPASSAVVRAPYNPPVAEKSKENLFSQQQSTPIQFTSQPGNSSASYSGPSGVTTQNGRMYAGGSPSFKENGGTEASQLAKKKPPHCDLPLAPGTPKPAECGGGISTDLDPGKSFVKKAAKSLGGIIKSIF